MTKKQKQKQKSKNKGSYALWEFQTTLAYLNSRSSPPPALNSTYMCAWAQVDFKQKLTNPD